MWLKSKRRTLALLTSTLASTCLVLGAGSPAAHASACTPEDNGAECPVIVDTTLLGGMYGSPQNTTPAFAAPGSLVDMAAHLLIDGTPDPTSGSFEVAVPAEAADTIVSPDALALRQYQLAINAPGVPTCRSATFRGNAGAIYYQESLGYVPWGVYLYNSFLDYGPWVNAVFVNGRKVDGKKQFYAPLLRSSWKHQPQGRDARRNCHNGRGSH